MNSIEESRAARPPALLTGAVLVFWGVLTGHIVTGVLLAAVTEGHRLVRSRWELSDELIARIWNLCFVLFVGTAIVSVFRVGATQVVYVCVQWLPVLFCPLMLAQVFGARDRLPVSSFSAVARYLQRADRPAGGQPRPGMALNIEYGYAGTTIVAAGIANRQDALFYLGAAGLLGWALWQVGVGSLGSSSAGAGRRAVIGRIVGWTVAMCIAAGLGYIGHIGLHRLHVFLEQNAFLTMSRQDEFDQNRAFTRIGQLGRIKGSPSILWRLRVTRGSVPAYLRVASYSLYRHGLWFGRGAKTFAAARGEGAPKKTSWRLPVVPGTTAGAGVALRGRSRAGEVFLPVPGTTVALHGLPAARVARNRLGLVKAFEVPRILSFRAEYLDTLEGDTPPTDDDLELPTVEQDGLARIAAELRLKDPDPNKTLARLAAFFHRNFKYTTSLAIADEDETHGSSPLLRFLEQERAGHCEYFASATVLLLRQAGIPARYVVGYAVAEYGERSKEWLVRGTHAHAWAQAWVDGAWRIVENTPADWSERDSAGLSWFQPVKDWLNSVPYAFAQWRDSPGGARTIRVFKWAALPVLAFYLWFRLFRGRRGKRVRLRDAPAPSEAAEMPGMDSDAFLLEQRLAQIVEPRARSEPLRKWWLRVGAAAGDVLPEKLKREVDEAIALHYRLRFDPDGLGAGGREKLRVLVRASIARLGGKGTAPG